MSLPLFLNNLTQLATRPMTVQRAEWASNAFWKLSGMRTTCIPYEGGERAYYVEADDLKRTLKLEAEKIITHEGWIRHLELYKKGKSDFNSIEQNISKLDKGSKPKEILEVLNKWYELLNRWGIFGFCPFAVEGVIDPMFRDAISTLSKEKQDKIISTVSTPSILNAYQEMRLEIAEASIAHDLSKAKDLESKYNWYSEYSFVEPLLDEEYFASEIQKVDPVMAKLEKENILHDVEENRKNYALLLNEVFDDQTRLLAEIIHTYTFLRTDRIDIYKKGQSKIRRVYELIAMLLTEETGKEWTREYVVNLNNNEIISFLEKKEIPRIEDIDVRVSGKYIYLFDKGEPQIFTDDKSITEAQQMMYKEETNEIKGFTAYKGKVTGRVVMVRSKNDLGKVKEGDVLVSRITMPDYTPAMKIACAFITEEGGITSHAAIIARELKKPCLVGTGNCTKILKDGDMVEVDAEKGIVRVIKQ